MAILYRGWEHFSRFFPEKTGQFFSIKNNGLNHFDDGFVQILPEIFGRNAWGEQQYLITSYDILFMIIFFLGWAANGPKHFRNHEETTR